MVVRVETTSFGGKICNFKIFEGVRIEEKFCKNSDFWNRGTKWNSRYKWFFFPKIILGQSVIEICESLTSIFIASLI